MRDMDLRPHVLLIDESQVLLDLFQRFLVQAGYRVTVSRDLPTKRQLLALTPEVIVLEVLAYGGVEVGWAYLTRLRQDPDTAGIPVVLCSTAESLRHNPALATTLDRWGVRVLHKPIHLTHLGTAVAEVLVAEPRIDQALDP